MNYRNVVLLAAFGAACGSPSTSDPSSVVVHQNAGANLRGSITGLVHDARGVALANASVHLVDSDVYADAKTDANGRFAFSGIPAGAAAVVTVTTTGYNQVVVRATIPDYVIGTSDTPQENRSIDADVMLFKLDGQYQIQVKGLTDGAVDTTTPTVVQHALKSLDGLDVIGIVDLPCSLNAGVFSCTSTLQVVGTYTSAFVSPVLGTIAFTGMPNLFDTSYWCDGRSLCGASNYSTNFLNLIARESATDAVLEYCESTQTFNTELLTVHEYDPASTTPVQYFPTVNLPKYVIDGLVGHCCASATKC